MTVVHWSEESEQLLTLRRSCECGCDSRGGDKGVGYLIGGGVTIWIEDDRTYHKLEAALNARDRDVRDDERGV